MSTLGERRTVVNTLSVRGAGRDSLAMRLRVERLFDAVDLHPPSLSPSAILCVRRIVDPRPGLFPLDGKSLRPPRVWQDALAAELEVVVRHAARPAREGVGAAANAVLFSDRSELLACLATDFLRGHVTSRWWWQSLVPEVFAERAAIKAWLVAPEHVPSALHLLVLRGEAAPFVRALTLEEVQTLAAKLSDRFGTRAPIAAMAAEPRAARNSAPQLPTRDAPYAERLPASAGARRNDEPWASWAPEILAEDLDSVRRGLLGVALALHRAPSAARSLAFLHAVEQWATPRGSGEARHEEKTAPNVDRDVLVVERLETLDNVISDRGVGGLRPSLESIATEPSAASVVSAVSSVPAQRSSPLPITSDAASPLPVPVPSLPQPAEIQAELPPPALAAAEVAPPVPFSADFSAPVEVPSELALPAPADCAVPSDPPTRHLLAPVHTMFGGVFFLINLGLYLDLYGDFSTPLSPGIDLSLWDFIALVGHDLAGDALTDDPVWHLLAELSGRDKDYPPGTGFVPPPDWRIPTSWLHAFDGDPIEQARLTTAPSVAEGAAPLERWLAIVLPYVRARLARAFAVEAERAARLACAIPAHVHVTATHLDVVMSLADLPVEVRLAGLDRDPGWVPAAGRSVVFHFQ